MYSAETRKKLADSEKRKGVGEPVFDEEVRISWTIPGYGSGCGSWHPDCVRDAFEENCRILNNEYGYRTHWVEVRSGSNATKSPSD